MLPSREAGTWKRALPEEAPWLAEYLHEMTVFPKGKQARRPGRLDPSVPGLVQNAYAGVGCIRDRSDRGRKIEAAADGLRPPQGATRDRRGPDAVRPTQSASPIS